MSEIKSFNRFKRFIKNFIYTKDSYWSKEKPMSKDIRSFLQNVADEENNWVLETFDDADDEQ